MDLPVFQPSNTVLPPLYGRWMDALLGRGIPPETEATCADCAMCAGDARENMPAGYYFDPGIKCCSFIPELPNFLVGGILADDDPAAAMGRVTLESRIAAGVAVTPFGLGRHPTYQMLYEHMTSVAGFGRSRTIRCPHYLEEQGGICGIWRHRESTCATWFCKHVRGATGKGFWATLQQLLSGLELELARWCVIELDPGREAMARLFASPTAASAGDPIKEGHLDGVPDPQIQQANWGRWAGREREFYLECARRVESLAWEDVLAVCGPSIRAFTALTVDAFERLTSAEVPQRLRIGPFSLLQASASFSRVESYSNCDPLDVPKVVLDVLHCFDGRPTDDVLRTIAIERGVQLDDSLVRKLADFGILVPA